VTGCGRGVCGECWVGYLRVEVEEKGMVKVRCPADERCGDWVPVERMRKLGRRETVEKLEAFLVESFVKAREEVRWCAAPGCECAIKVNQTTSKPSVDQKVVCRCSNVTCIMCPEDPHFPMSCKIVRKWEDKAVCDRATSLWLSANSKPCPKCKLVIAKDGGCNHVTCSKCRHEFCWMCMRGTGDHFCCKTQEDNADQAKSRSELERYKRHYERYKMHEDSARLAGKFFEKTEKKIAALVDSSEHMTYIDFDYLNKAVELIFECRRVLKYSYGAMFFEEVANRELVAGLQGELEYALERLNKAVEQHVEDLDEKGIIELTGSVRARLDNFIKCF